MTNPEKSANSAFITYSSRDETQALENSKVFSNYGFDIHHGQTPDDEITSFAAYESEIRNSTIFIPFLTSAMVESETCRRDIFIASMNEVPIISVILEETEIDDTLLNTLGEKNPIRRYALSEDAYHTKCNEKLDNIFSKEGNGFKAFRYMKELLTGRQPNAMQLDTGTYFYFSFHHEDINQAFEDISRPTHENLTIIYDTEIDFREEPNKEWKSKTLNSIKKSSLLIFYATENSIKSKRRMFELQSATENDIPVCFICLEDIPKISSHHHIILKYKLSDDQYDIEYTETVGNVMGWMR